LVSVGNVITIEPMPMFFLGAEVLPNGELFIQIGEN
jgi:hypothetical protein